LDPGILARPSVLPAKSVVFAGARSLEAPPAAAAGHIRAWTRARASTPDRPPRPDAP